MHLYVGEQAEIFRCAFLFGVCLGAGYDVFRLLRALGFCSKRAVFFQDVIFCCVSSVACFLFAQTTVHGRFRLYVMAAHLLGLLAFRLSVGIVTGKLYSVAGRLYKAVSARVEKAFVIFAGVLRRVSANLSRNIRKKRELRSIAKQHRASDGNKTDKNRKNHRFLTYRTRHIEKNLN